LTREFERMEKEGATSEELDQFGVGKLPLAARDGDIENGSVMAGQSAGLVKSIMPAADIIQEILADFYEAANLLSSYASLGGDCVE